MNQELLSTLVGKTVKVDRGGPESRIGKLMDVGEDFFTILTEEDGIVIYSTHHIKSLTQNSRNELPFDLEIPEGFEIITGPSFKSVLDSLKYYWVKINRGGKESVEGVLESATDDYLTLIVGEEVIRIAMFHIRNVSYGATIEKPMKEKKDKEAKKDKGKEAKKEGERETNKAAEANKEPEAMKEQKKAEDNEKPAEDEKEQDKEKKKE